MRTKTINLVNKYAIRKNNNELFFALRFYYTCMDYGFVSHKDARVILKTFSSNNENLNALRSNRYIANFCIVHDDCFEILSPEHVIENLFLYGKRTMITVPSKCVVRNKDFKAALYGTIINRRRLTRSNIEKQTGMTKDKQFVAEKNANVRVKDKHIELEGEIHDGPVKMINGRPHKQIGNRFFYACGYPKDEMFNLWNEENPQSKLVSDPNLEKTGYSTYKVI